MTEQTMTPAEVLAVLNRANSILDVHGYMHTATRVREAHTAVAALIARNAELEADRDHLLTSLRIIRDCEFFGGDEWLQAVEVLQKMAGNAIAHNEKAQAARAEASSHG